MLPGTVLPGRVLAGPSWVVTSAAAHAATATAIVDVTSRRRRRVTGLCAGNDAAAGCYFAQRVAVAVHKHYRDALALRQAGEGGGHCSQA